MVKIKLHPLITVRQPSLAARFSFEGKDILNAFQDHKLKEMLYTSSPSLYHEYERWEEGLLDEKRKNKLKNSLYKYSLRMRFRSTPFGLLSEVYTIEQEKLKRGVCRKSVKRISRLDTKIIQQLIFKAENLEGIFTHLKFRANNSIYQVNNELRYFRHNHERPEHAAEINKIKFDLILKEVLDYCKNPRTGKQISHFLKKHCDSKLERKNYLKQLINVQLLQSNLNISLSEGDQLSRLIRIIQDIKNEKACKSHRIKSFYSNLVRLKLRLIRLDKSDRKRLSAYKAIRRQLINMGLKVDESAFIQIDQFGEMEPFDHAAVFELPDQAELSELVDFLARFSSSNSSPGLERFKTRFQRRYGDCQANILKVMDPEIGLGYAEHSSELMGSSPLLQDLSLDDANPSPKNNVASLPLFLQESLAEAMMNGERQISFNKGKIKRPKKKINLPLSFSAVLKVVELQDGKDGFLIKDIGGHHASHYLARFINDSALTARLAKEIARHEESCLSNSKIAQCYHAYASRAANINQRPILYSSSLHLLDNQTRLNGQLDWSDIEVHVEEDQIALFDSKGNQSVIPRITSAMDFRINTLPIHHFLGDLQSQGRVHDLNFYWGDYERHLKHLPRVSFGRFILHPEQWILDTKELNAKLKPSDFEEWRLQKQIPDQCLFIEGDQELLLNFNYPEAIDLFFSMISKYKKIQLYEYLGPKKGMIKDSNGDPLEHEIILSLMNEEEKKESKYHPIKKSQETRIPSENSYRESNQWIYFKVYTNPLRTEKLLQELFPEINRLKRKQCIRDWFFIRYVDPDHHLRLRFRSESLEYRNHIMASLKDSLDSLQEAGLAWKIVVDQYQAEIKRYGRKSIRLCERLFHWDSEAILRFLNSFKGQKKELLRWQMAVLLIQEWFELFKLSETERKFYLESWCKAFKSETQFKNASKQSLAKQWRSKRSRIDQLIKKGKLRDLDAKLMSAIAAEKSLRSYTFTDNILQLGDSNQMEVPKIDLLNSLCHMSCNRLFPHGARANEFVIYDLMWNYYRSEIARKNKLKKQ